MEKRPKSSSQKRKCSVGTAHNMNGSAFPSIKMSKNVNTDTFLIQCPSPNKSISHIFEFPSTNNTIAYYHAAEVFFTKETWTDAIRAGNYDTWPDLTVKSVSK